MTLIEIVTARITKVLDEHVANIPMSAQDDIAQILTLAQIDPAAFEEYTPSDLGEIRDAAQAATPGPWQWEGEKGGGGEDGTWLVGGKGASEYVLTSTCDKECCRPLDIRDVNGSTADKEFISLAREVVPELVERLERSEEMLLRVNALAPVLVASVAYSLPWIPT